MPRYSFIVLDAYPLGNAAVVKAKPGVAPTDSERCRQWMDDADAILAAQVLSLNLPARQFVVATRNSGHITRFGLPADEWQNITP